MADNVTYSNKPSGVPSGTSIATDEVDGKHIQRVKLDVGGDGVSTPVTDLATSANQTNGTQKTKITDGTNVIDAHLTTDGGYHLGVQMQQSVYDDANNSSTANLAAGATFTGTGTSTLGVVGLQWSLKTDQNCTVYIEESPDNSNWDISYAFDYIASQGGRGETVQASQAYWRIRVTNDGLSTTSYFRLSGILCPVATPLPSDLSADGRVKSESTLTGQQNTNRHVWVTPLNEISIAPKYRLVGKSFGGSTKDTNFWTESVTNAGTVTQTTGVIKLETNTTANATTKYYTNHRARFVSGYPNLFQGGFNFVTAGTADNIRRFGAYDGTEGVDGDGYYFELDGTSFSVGTRKGGTDTRVTSGSFNGNFGVAWSPTANTYYRFSIEMTPMGTFWYVNGTLLHKTAGGNQSGTITLPVTIENNNDNNQDADVALHCIGGLISREGQIQTESIYYHLSGNAATHTLKQGAGTLHKIIFNNTSGTSVTIYDNTAGSGDVIGVITTASGAIGSWNYDVPFSTGLTLVTVGNSLDATIVYE